MASIETLMKTRDNLSEQMNALPIDVSTDKTFHEIFERRWAIEQTILSCAALTLAEQKAQLVILAARAVVFDVAEDLARLSA